jgi:proliferating cell nuclear antigen
MFKLTYPVGSNLKKIMQGAVKPLDEVPIKVSDSFLIRALSPDKNTLTEINIPQTAFDVFDVEGENSIVVDRDQFLKSLRRATRRDSVTFEFKDESRYLNLALINTKTGAERIYQVEIREIGQELIQSLNLDLPIKFQIPTDDLKAIIRNAKIVGEELEIIYKEGKVEISCRSENKMFKQILEFGKPLLNLEAKESMVTSKYDLDLLKTVAVSFDAADVANVEFGPSLPMKIFLDIGDGSTVVFWIAPRV